MHYHNTPGVIFWLIHNNTSDGPVLAALAEKAYATQLFSHIVDIANTLDAKRWPLLASEVPVPRCPAYRRREI